MLRRQDLPRPGDDRGTRGLVAAQQCRRGRGNQRRRHHGAHGPRGDAADHVPSPRQAFPGLARPRELDRSWRAARRAALGATQALGRQAGRGRRPVVAELAGHPCAGKTECGPEHPQRRSATPSQNQRSPSLGRATGALPARRQMSHLHPLWPAPMVQAVHSGYIHGRRGAMAPVLLPRCHESRRAHTPISRLGSLLPPAAGTAGKTERDPGAPSRRAGPLAIGGRLPGSRSGTNTRRTAGYSCSAAVGAC